LSQDTGFIGELLRLSESLGSTSNDLQSLRKPLKELLQHPGLPDEFGNVSDERLISLLRRAEARCLDLLIETEVES